MTELRTADEKIGIAEMLLQMRDQLRVGKKVLLASVWCCEDERMLFHKYPEILMADVTLSTNAQGRPEFITCSPGPDMKVFTPLHAFLPSQ